MYIQIRRDTYEIVVWIYTPNGKFRATSENVLTFFPTGLDASNTFVIICDNVE